jgi:hypothetical protein
MPWAGPAPARDKIFQLPPANVSSLAKVPDPFSQRANLRTNVMPNGYNDLLFVCFDAGLDSR